MRKATTIAMLAFLPALIFPGDLVDAQETYGRDWSQAEHFPGSVVNEDGTVYYLDFDYELDEVNLEFTIVKRPFPTKGTFYSNGFEFDQVVPASVGDRQLPVGDPMRFGDGDLITDGGVVYIIFNDRKFGFAPKKFSKVWDTHLRTSILEIYLTTKRAIRSQTQTPFMNMAH